MHSRGINIRNNTSQGTRFQYQQFHCIDVQRISLRYLCNERLLQWIYEDRQVR